MPTLKRYAKTLLNAVYAARAWLYLKRVNKPTLIILTYHRVLPLQDWNRSFEQPGMIVSPENLSRHIEHLTSMGAKPVFLDDWISREADREPLPKLAFAITFDDGWQDNYDHALPILKAHKVPAIIFLVSGMVNSRASFWPERVLYILTQALKAPTTADALSALGWLEPYADHYPFAARAATLEEADVVINRLKEMDDATISDQLDTTCQQFPELAMPGDLRHILNLHELVAMQASGLVRFGAHTRHHYRLNLLARADQLKAEVVDCRDDLSELLNQPINLFCYPNGDITPEGEEMVKRCYRGACTTRTGFNFSGRSPYALQRFNLHDGNSGSRLALAATLGRGVH